VNVYFIIRLILAVIQIKTIHDFCMKTSSLALKNGLDLSFFMNPMFCWSYSQQFGCAWK